jgi:hypothetical protein
LALFRGSLWPFLSQSRHVYGLFIVRYQFGPLMSPVRVPSIYGGFLFMVGSCFQVGLMSLLVPAVYVFGEFLGSGSRSVGYG